MNPLYASVAHRAEHRCEYCHAPEAIFNFPFEVEHIVPPARGGADDESNTALACRACNLFKSDQIETADPTSQTAVRLFHPREDAWHDHFHIEPDSGVLAGLTPIGRGTIAQLKMNSHVQVAARLQWMRLGLFP